MTARAIKTALLVATLGIAGCFVPVPHPEPVYGPSAVVIERPYRGWWWGGQRHRRRYVERRRYDYDRSRRYADRHRGWYDD